ncbi:MAG: anaerobic sulfatase maturase [Acidobacteriota bacterium]
MLPNSIPGRPATPPKKVRPFHILTKPIGAVCNLDCSYCFYLGKESLYPQKSAHGDFRMSDTVLENYVRQYIAIQNAPEIHFAWQGGEPTLMGLDFFRRVVALQRRYKGGKTVHNALQTNGILLTDEWCAFLREQEFLVGLSIDGPADLHDRYRRDKAGRPTHTRTMEAWKRLKAHDVDVNTLTVVHRRNAAGALEVYEFLKANGARVMQFIPLVERASPPDATSADTVRPLSRPPDPLQPRPDPAAAVTPWSVSPEGFGAFLCRIFDHWVRRDVGRAETCGRTLAMEHNGDVYACDHYVFPEFHRGNIVRNTMAELAQGPQQQRFGEAKRDTLPAFCRRCEVLKYCRGECPKHRFTTTPSGDPGLQYLCPSYKRFFKHIKPGLETMARLIRARRAPAEIMRMV